MKTCIVVPTIREKSVQEFLEAWGPEFREHAMTTREIIVLEDNPECSFKLPGWVTHVSWKEIDADLKEDAWIIPRRTGAIRNYGNLLASRIKGLDMIVNLDDDCMPDTSNPLTRPGDFLDNHWGSLESPGLSLPCFDTMERLCLFNDGVRPRGYPKNIPEMRTMLNHGLWNGVPDIDGETQLRVGPIAVSFDWHVRQVPPGVMFPMSAMNIAFRPELLPAMYNLPMGQGQPFHRFDDIWCGLIMKKACDAMGWSVRSGSPCIRHVRASNAKRNAELEAPGIVENERVWELLARGDFGCESVPDDPPSLDAWLYTIHVVLMYLGDYWRRAHRAACIWRRLVTERK